MTLHLTNPTRRLLITLLAVLSIVATALPTAFLLPADAATTAGFEIDGDYTGTADWAGVPSSGLTTINEPTPDIIYGDGNPDGKESGYPSGWKFQTGTASPGKNDLTVGYLHSKTHNGRHWLMIAVERAEATGGGDTDVLVEFNQTDWTGTGTAITPGGRTVGDLLVQFDLKGQNAVNPTLVASRWSGTAWTQVGVTYDSAINAGQITNLRNQAIAPGTFGEVALDLTAVYAGQADPCVTFGSTFARTQTSGGGQDPQLTDILGPENGLILSTCGTITVKKEDAEGRGLQGATFALYEDDGDEAFEPDGHDGPAVDTCETGTTGTCAFTDVEPAPTKYWIKETVEPTEYQLSASTVYGPFSISTRQDFVVPAGTFQNPRIPHAIDVRMDATNLLGDEHVFVVTLTKGATASEQPDSGSQQLSVPVSGATVNLTWARGSGTDSHITHIEDANGGPTATGDVLTTSCVTRDDSGGADEEGTCLVTVNSATAGSGTLTGSYTITSYQHVTGAATNPTWWTSSARSVSDTATKTWVDYSATVATTARNMVGESHLFTINVVGPAGADLDAPAATVGFWWSGTGTVEEINGSDAFTSAGTDATLGTLYGCDVQVPDSNDTSAGNCTVEVGSNAVGPGTITIAYIDVGDIDGDNGNDRIDYDVDGEGEDLGRTSTVDQSATKTWVDFSAEVDDGATNLVGDDHTFTVTAHEYDGDGEEDTDAPEDAEAAAGVTVAFAWTGDGTVSSVNGATPTTAGGLYTCTTNASGRCSVVVSSSSVGSGTITIAYVDVTGFVDGDLTRVTYDHDASTAPTDDDGDTATKHWIDFDATVGDTATNLVDDPHTFRIDVSGTPQDLGQVVVGFVWTGTGSVQDVNGADPVLDGDGSYTCSPVEGSCTVTVNSSDPGTGEITIAYLDLGSYVEGATTRIDYDHDASTTSTDDDGSTASKTWVRFVVDITPDGHVNRSDANHTFTVTVKKQTADGVFIAPDDGTTVDLAWAAPDPVADGDGIIANTCADPGTVERFDTMTQESLDSGICTVTVVDDYGTGTLTATAVNGVIEVEGDPVTYDFTDHGDADPSVTKTWGDFRVAVSEDAENLLGDPNHVFTVTVEQRFSTDPELGDDEDNWVAVEDETFLSLGWTGNEEIVSDTCRETSGIGTVGGVCTVTVTATATGSGTLTATFGASLDSGDFTVFDRGTKTWIDYDVTVDPVAAENLIDSQHVFTVTVFKDSGTGTVERLSGGFPSLAIVSGPGSIIAPSNLCASTGTGANGECTVTISSTETGTTTVRASYLGAAADSAAQTFTSDPATKKWVDYAIDVDPDRAVNPVGTTHTFTVTLQRIEDGVASVAAGASVSLGIVGPGEIIEIPGGTIVADARSGSCTTDAAGRCTVTIASDDVGDTTLTATYDAVVGESTGTFSDSGLKLWRSDPAIELIKDAEIEPTAEGLKIISCNADGCPETTFTFTVTNVGGVALHDVTLVDDKFGPITLARTELAVGESTTGTATYVPSRQEIDAGIHENLGTVTGVSPDGQTVRDDDPEEVQILEVLPLPPIERPPAPAPAPEPLPRTGADVAWLTAEGLLALLIGWVMVWVGRRKADEQES